MPRPSWRGFFVWIDENRRQHQKVTAFRPIKFINYIDLGEIFKFRWNLATIL